MNKAREEVNELLCLHYSTGRMREQIMSDENQVEQMGMIFIFLCHRLFSFFPLLSSFRLLFIAILPPAAMIVQFQQCHKSVSLSQSQFFHLTTVDCARIKRLNYTHVQSSLQHELQDWARPQEHVMYLREIDWGVIGVRLSFHGNQNTGALLF